MRKRIKTDLLIHDLKVPLAVVETGIISLLQRREKYGPITEKQEKVLARALRNTKVIQSLVNDILELGKSRKRIVSLKSLKFSDLIEQTLVETFDLVDRNTSEIINICADLPQLRDTLEERGLMLFMEEALWCQEVCLDEVKIRQILRNLLINALKYRKSRVELEVDKKGVYLVFSVKDDGEGIPSIYHKKIFERYFQIDVTDSSTVRGHGLGLAGVMILVEDMGGELFLESDEGKGAKF
ncbi:MAG: sensor histidine kinase, partial [Deltaproteobacteria bacterium]|nr:sensor histidine kinase [Deltaproteobacteria bacterium]